MPRYVVEITTRNSVIVITNQEAKVAETALYQALVSEQVRTDDVVALMVREVTEKPNDTPAP